MTDVSNTIEYILSVKDESSATLAGIKERSADTQQTLTDLSATQQELGADAVDVTAKLNQVGNTASAVGGQASQALSAIDTQTMATQTKLTAQLSAINGLKGALHGTISSMTTLGLLTDEEAQKLNLVTNAFGLVASAGQGLTAIRTLMSSINVQSGILATIETYVQTLSNPAKLAIVGAGLGAAGLVGGYLLGSTTTNNSTTNNSITIQDTSAPTAKQTAEAVYNTIGGAL